MAMEGYVSAAPRESRLTVNILDNGGTATPIEFAIDTGFTGFMTLPTEIIGNLGLQRLDDDQPMILAHGQTIVTSIYEAIVIWHGSARRIIVIAMPGRPTIGMHLLWGSDVAIAVRTNGRVAITDSSGS